MGKSITCFKIIACGSDTAENEAAEVPENKSSRGWSFRKRSERHRVLSNTVIAETPSGHKEIPASIGLNFQPPDSSAVPEKISAQKYIEEKPQSLALLPAQESDPIAAVTNESDEEVSLEESVVVIIQTAIRGFLAQRDLVKRKNAVKLQAAVRGHLVRKHAVGTLRCVQAIVKMQALIRARRARQSLEGSYTERKSDGKPEKDNLGLQQEKSGTKPNVTYTSLEKLLSNKFARQLMGSTPKTKPIDIKCDPLKPNSAWSWLERWMSISVTEQSPKLESVNDQPETEKNEDIAFPVDGGAPSEPSSESSGLKSVVRETIVSSESEGNLITYHADKVKFEVSQPTPLETDNLQQPQLESPVIVSSESEENLITYHADKAKFEVSQPTPLETDNLQQPQLESPGAADQKETSAEATSINETSVEISSKRDQTVQSDENSDQKETSAEATSINENSVEISSKRDQTIQSDENAETEASCPPCKLETENGQPKRSMKRLASDQLETEGKKYVFGSRKASNPAFIAAQTKFEELSSTGNSCRSISSSYQDVGVEPDVDTVSSGADTDSKTKERSTSEPPVYNNSVVHRAGSECGTELSISSTLDSPDRSEVGTIGSEQGAKLSGQENSGSNTTKDLDDKSYDTSTIPLSNEFRSVTDKPEIFDGVGKSGNSDEAVDSPQVEQEPEKILADPQKKLEPEKCHQASPEAFPRSHMTIPETPSSEVSVKAKKSKTDKRNQKRKSMSAGKSPVNDSGARSSMEQLPKDQKSGKGCNSFGSTQPENIDQEPRDSNSSNSLPHFMQATESARAKVQPNNSPRSSPDLHDRDIYIKKRHSLPGANGRQGSPRIQRSMSQAQQGAKGNGTPPLHERKWQR